MADIWKQVFISTALICCFQNVFTECKKALTKTEQMDYLTKYQYMGRNSPIISQKTLSWTNPDLALTEGVKIFQRKWGLKVSGIVDEDTENLMQTPRCGMADIVMNDMLIRRNHIGHPKWNLNIRQKRFNYLPGKGWKKTQITYKIINYTPDIPKNQIDDIFLKASQMWESAADFSLRPITNGYADIDIIFANGSHGDGFPFDGPSKTLAHTFYPKYGGDIHLDDGEDWKIDGSNGGVSLLQIVVHELGHALGLDHSEYDDSVLYPFYNFRDDLKLHSDDIQGIQYLYGTLESSSPTTTKSTTTAQTTRTTSATTPTTQSTTTTTTTAATTTTTQATTTPQTTTTATTTTTTAQTLVEIPCPVDFDAITLDEYGYLHIFKAKQHIKLQKHSEGYRFVQGFPKTIPDSYEGLPTEIDAAAHLPELQEVTCTRTFFFRTCQKTGNVLENARTYFFKGNTYYLIDGKVTSNGLIADKFTGVPNDIDSAFTIAGDNIFFIKGDKYWKASRMSETVDGPRLLSEFRGVPSSLQDSLHMSLFYNNMNHHVNIFFTGNGYYKITDGTYKVDSAEPNYPHSTADWLGCRQGMLKSADTSVSKRSTIEKGQISTNSAVFVDPKGHVINSMLVKWIKN